MTIRDIALAFIGLMLLGVAALFGIGRSDEQCAGRDPITGRPAEVGTFWCQAR